jgi:cob(I)alamin adenosyltransferase
MHIINMGLNKMKIYTRRGDAGETGLLGGEKVLKNSPRLEAIGTLDELNATLGLIRTESLPDDIDQLLERLQNELFNVGTELATVAPARSPCPTVSTVHIHAIEEAIDLYDSKLEPLKGFILPGGARLAALFHIARTICRRAERKMIDLLQLENQALSPDMLAYINRLSDLLYVLARYSNTLAGVADVPWRKT